VRRRREQQSRLAARRREDSRQLSIFPEPAGVEEPPGPEVEARERRAEIRARLERRLAQPRTRRPRSLVDAGEVAISTRGNHALAAETEIAIELADTAEAEGPVEAPGPGAAQRAGLALPGERLLAALVDTGIVAVLLLGLAYLTANMLGRSLAGLPAVSQVALGCVGFFIAAGYLVFFWASSGQTLGGALSGVRVVDPAGRPIGFAAALLRGLGLLLSLGALGAGLVGWWTDSERRGWPDRLASTRVVRG
jgi:uncharacterized RDD family membrane protein YckC